MEELHIGFVSTRFAGLDGVSLEALKLAEIFESQGHTVSWFAGRVGNEFSPRWEAPDAYFDTQRNVAMNKRVFGVSECGEGDLAEIHALAASVRADLDAYIDEFSPDVLVPQNASAIPMSRPLGLAIARCIADTGIAAVAHHHDFAWERERFWPNAVGPILDEAFPPVARTLSHLVINTIARDELLRRKGVHAHVLPNIMDFDRPPPAGDASVFRAAADVSATDVLLLQPTRMIPRKGIEDTFELARRLAEPSIKVVVTHPEPDEGAGYVEQLRATADDLGVDFRIVPAGPGTGVRLADAYAAANLVTYPSRIEGFGNALLEAFYFRRPVLVNRYPVYAADIAPLGVAAIEMTGEITDEVVAKAERWLADSGEWSEAVEMNYDIGLRHFGYGTARDVLHAALGEVT